jgi:hypothetical protein
VAAVTRLLTLVDVDDADDDGPDSHRMSVRARHEAVLEDGRRVVLVDDRGWSGTVGVVSDGDAPPSAEDVGSLSAWAHETVESMERTARDVVGPDEPPEGRSWAEEEAGHWDALAGILRVEGVEVSGAELMALPHDVELSDRVLARLA